MKYIDLFLFFFVTLEIFIKIFFITLHFKRNTFGSIYYDKFRITLMDTCSYIKSPYVFKQILA